MGLPWKQNQGALHRADHGFCFKTSLLHSSLLLGIQPSLLNLQFGIFNMIISNNVKKNHTNS